jgi:hypothetical protein
MQSPADRGTVNSDGNVGHNDPNLVQCAAPSCLAVARSEGVPDSRVQGVSAQLHQPLLACTKVWFLDHEATDPGEDVLDA